MEAKQRIDILFLDGFFSGFELTSFLGYIYPIGAVLKKFSYNYKIFNLQLLPEYTIENLLSEIESLNIGTIGISTHGDNVKFVYDVVNEIKSKFPNLPIILGGAQASFNDLKIMENCKADVIIRHEGEIKLVKILDYFLNKTGALKDIGGVTYREQNHIISNKDIEVIDLNAIPTFDYSIINDINYWHVPDSCTTQEVNNFLYRINLENNVYVGSRGCPYKCIFCVEGNLKQKHRMRSPENIYKDLESLLLNTKSQFIIFGDDTFTATKSRIIEMCKIINKLRERFDFYWFAEGRVNVLAKHPELVRFMAESGMIILQVGIESGSQKVLDAMNKKITKDELKRVFQEIGSINDIDIRITGNLILGCPEETKDTLLETLEFTKELHYLANFNSQIQYSFLVPFKGTPIGDNPEKYNIEVIDNEFELSMHQFREIICHSKYISYHELDRMNSFYNKEFVEFYKSNIFNLSKEVIDRRIMNDRYYSKNYGIRFDINSWLVTIYSYIFILSYYNLFEKRYIVKNIDNIDLDFYPVGLWELDFDINRNCYTFETLAGEEILIKGKHIYLWEMANGQNTIKDIIYNVNSPFKDLQNPLNDILSFYNSLFNTFALVYSEI
ncbi:B12-binding domain-containing radical SAM protein [Phocaeicola paurosaccharolyticus]|uniref:B12-binding domain-containing radical SAM protein n=1 Tax=Phocaeicola paurosaccharolyticus TaxID=732242 RepID=UPI00046A5F90|nr:radical SAM protein [Phocaeicola paurosaccharolyticus]